MDFVGAFVTDSESTILMKPRKGSFNHPAVFSQAASVFCATLGNHRFNPQGAQNAPVGTRIVPPIRQKGVWSATGSPHLPRNRENRFEQGNQLSHVVTVGPREGEAEGNTLAVRKKVVFRPQLPSIRRVRARFFPPPMARTDALSATALDQSILSASRSLVNRRRWSFSHTPASCHSWSLVQHALPHPHPISLGSIAQGMPLLSTKRIPAKALRESKGLRPGYRNRLGLGGGNKGVISFHNSSSTKHLAMCPPPWIGYTHGFSAKNVDKFFHL